MNKVITPSRITVNVYDNFASWLKEKMAYYGTSSDELARAVGMRRSTISAYLNNQRSPKLEIVAMIFDFFGEDEIRISLKEAKE